jgi:hypothetical protein
MPAATKAQMIATILGTAKQAAVVSNRTEHYQANAADSFISLAFKTDKELRTICRKIGAVC